jgi:hypothetical protein
MKVRDGFQQVPSEVGVGAARIPIKVNVHKKTLELILTLSITAL